jgi:hypothetical protein
MPWLPQVTVLEAEGQAGPFSLMFRGASLMHLRYRQKEGKAEITTTTIATVRVVVVAVE